MLRNYLRRVIGLGAAVATGQGLFILASPLLSRLYSPQAFGEFALYMALAPVLTLAATQRYEAAILAAENDTEGAALTRLCIENLLKTALVVALVTPLVVSVASKGLPVSPHWLWMPFTVIGLGLFQTFSFWRVRHMEYRTLGQAKFVQGMSGCLTQLGLGILGGGTSGLIVGDAISRWLSGFTLARGARAILHSISRAEVRFVAQRYRRFAVVGIPDALLSLAALYLPLWMVSSLYNEQEVGWYGFVERIIAGIAGLLAQALGQVYSGYAVAQRQQNESLMSLLRVVLLYQGALLLPVYLFAVSVALPWAIHSLLDDRWTPAATLALPIGLMYAGTLIVAPFSSTLNIINRPDWLLRWNIVRVGGMTGLFLTACFLQWNLTSLAWGLGLWYTATYMLLLGIILTVLGRQ